MYTLQNLLLLPLLALRALAQASKTPPHKFIQSNNLYHISPAVYGQKQDQKSSSKWPSLRIKGEVENACRIVDTGAVTRAPGKVREAYPFSRPQQFNLTKNALTIYDSVL